MASFLVFAGFSLSDNPLEQNFGLLRPHEPFDELLSIRLHDTIIVYLI